MKEYVFGFKIAAALQQNFNTAFSSASAKILKLNSKMKEHRLIAKAAASAVKQGSISIESYNNVLTKLSSSYSKLNDKANRYLKLQGKVNQRRTSMNNSESNMISLAGISYSLAFPLKQAIKFEEAMSDVRKVVDFANEQEFKQMNQSILDLSKALPMTSKELAAIVAAGGQSGIAKNDLLKFAEAAAKMGTAFDITADQAGEMMAKWRTAFNINQKEVELLADKVNYLSNKTAASAPLISDVVTRIGPLGAVGGMASGEIAALGASLVGSGIQSEVAATGIKNLILTMVAGESATKGQKEAFSALGYNATEMAKRMQTDAKGAILDVMKAIKGLDKEKQAATLQNLFGKESIGAIAPLLSNLHGLEKNLSLVAENGGYVNSMQDEFFTKSQTTANQIQMMKNNFYALTTEIGNGMLPVFKSAFDILAPAGKFFANLVTEHSELTSWVFLSASAFTGFGLAINAVSWVWNGVHLGINGICYALHDCYNWLGENITRTKLYNLTNKAMIKATKIWTTVQWAWNAAMTANPIGMVIVGIGALIAIGYTLYRNWDTVSKGIVDGWNWIKNGVINIAKVYWDFWLNLPEKAAYAVGMVVGFVSTLPERLLDIVYSCGEVGSAFIENAKLWGSQGLEGLVETFSNLPTILKNLTVNAWEEAKNFLSSKFISIKVAYEEGKQAGSYTPVAQNAYGGIYGKGAFLTTFAEKSGESAIPHTPTPRNIGLLAETNRIMGNPLGGGVNATFAPNITVQGSADTAQIDNILTQKMREFKAMLEELQRRERRLSYA